MTDLPSINRRKFLGTAAAATTAAASLSVGADIASADAKAISAETLVGRLHKSLSERQRKDVCFGWDHKDKKRGLLRTFVANNWKITKREINSDFYNDEQRDLIKQVFESIVHPDWHERYYQQLEDDCGGFGHDQSIAIFGEPGQGKFELVLTGRHMTLRCDGNSADHVAFGGPIFYGHAPTDSEDATHIDNVFWSQAVKANELYKMLSGRQRKQAQVAKTPREQSVAFRGKNGEFTGLAGSDMSSDQKEHLQKVLGSLVQQYRQSDQDEAMKCLEAQGGLDACHLSFYTDKDIGKDKVWDNWRVEGPSFVWHFRGNPHVHVWVNLADSSDVKLNA